jgi:hypothetical protein
MTYNEEAPPPEHRGTGREEGIGLDDQSLLPEILPDPKTSKTSTFTFETILNGRQEVALGGRNRWLLRRLISCGLRGLTAAELPAGVRVSALVHNLRRAGIPIVSETERHDGEYPGNHCRYVLDTRVRELP